MIRGTGAFAAPVFFVISGERDRQIGRILKWTAHVLRRNKRRVRHVPTMQGRVPILPSRRLMK